MELYYKFINDKNMFNILKIFQKKQPYKSHLQLHREHMAQKRAEGVRRYYAEHGATRKVPSYEFGKLTGYLYLPRKKGFISAGAR